MVSLAYLVVLLSVFSAVVIAEDVKSSQTESQDEKWLGGYGYGYNRFGWGAGWNGWNTGFFNPGWGCNYNWINRWGPVGAYGYFGSGYPRAWFKQAEETNTPARRSIVAEAVAPRDGAAVACKNTQGQTDHFVAADCQKAIQALVAKKASSANCKSCSVKLVNPNGQLAATGAPVETLQKVGDQILKSCTAGAGGSSNNNARRSPAENSNSGGNAKEQFAMIFQKGDGHSCDA